MADTTFTSGTVVTSPWLNDVNYSVYKAASSLTGAVDRTALSRNADWVSVKDFGAIGNGIADDTVAIQTAISNYHNVWFPEGTYKTSAALTLRQDNQLIGANQQNTKLMFYGTHGLTATSSGGGAYDIRIENLSIIGNSAGVSKNGIHIDGTAANFGRVNLENLIISGFTGVGLKLTKPIVTHLRNIQSSSNGTYGFHILGDGTSVNAIGCYASLNTSDGWRIDNNLQYSSLISCASDANGGCGYNFAGSIATPAEGITLTSCGAESNSGDQFKFTGTLGLTLNSLFVFPGSPAAGGHYIVLDGCRHVSLNGIRMDTPAPATKYALYLDTMGGTQFPIDIRAAGCSFVSVNNSNDAYYNLDTVYNDTRILSGTATVANGGTITHNLGKVPKNVIITFGNANYIGDADLLTTTTMRALLLDNAGTPLGATAVRWTVIS